MKKINFRKYLLEQSEWKELTPEEKENVKAYADARVIRYFKELSPAYEVRKNGKWKDDNGITRDKWEKKLKGSTPPPTPPPPAPASEEYSCINNYNKAKNFDPLTALFDPLTALSDPNFAKEEAEDYNNRKSIYLYIPGKKIFHLYDDENKDEIKKGTWECSGNDSYTVKWEDGNINSYGNAGSSGSSGTAGSSGTSASLYKQVNFTGEDILNNNAEIKKFMRGGIVRKIQDYLKKLGFGNVSKSGRSDGDYGELTKKAVEDYQASTNGQLVDDGIVGDKTWTKMVEDILKKEKKVPQEIDVSDEISVDDEVNNIDY